MIKKLLKEMMDELLLNRCRTNSIGSVLVKLCAILGVGKSAGDVFLPGRRIQQKTEQILKSLSITIAVAFS